MQLIVRHSSHLAAKNEFHSALGSALPLAAVKCIIKLTFDEPIEGTRLSPSLSLPFLPANCSYNTT